MKRFLIIAAALVLALVLSTPYLLNYTYNETNKNEILTVFNRNFEHFQKDAIIYRNPLTYEADKLSAVYAVEFYDDYTNFLFGYKGIEPFRTHYGIFHDTKEALANGAAPGPDWGVSDKGFTYTKNGANLYIEEIGDGFYYYEGHS